VPLAEKVKDSFAGEGTPCRRDLRKKKNNPWRSLLKGASPEWYTRRQACAILGGHRGYVYEDVEWVAERRKAARGLIHRALLDL